MSERASAGAGDAPTFAETYADDFSRALARLSIALWADEESDGPGPSASEIVDEAIRRLAHPPARPETSEEAPPWVELRRLVEAGYAEEAGQFAKRMANETDIARAHREQLRREGRNPTDCIECGVGDGMHAIQCSRAAINERAQR